MTRYRVRVKQELVYLVEAANEDAAWEIVEADDFGDPCDFVESKHPDVLDLHEDDQ